MTNCLTEACTFSSAGLLLSSGSTHHLVYVKHDKDEASKRIETASFKNSRGHNEDMQSMVIIRLLVVSRVVLFEGCKWQKQGKYYVRVIGTSRA